MNDLTNKTQKRHKLQATYELHHRELYKEVNIASSRAIEFGKTMAVMSGVLYLGYAVLDRFLDAKLRTEKKTKEPGNFEVLNKIILPVLALALQQGSMVLLKRARESLIKYIEKKETEDV